MFQLFLLLRMAVFPMTDVFALLRAPPRRLQQLRGCERRLAMATRGSLPRGRQALPQLHQGAQTNPLRLQGQILRRVPLLPGDTLLGFRG